MDHRGEAPQRAGGALLTYARRRSWKAALALFFCGMGAPILLMWWFLNPIPGKPDLAELDMARVEGAYWLMGLTEVLAFAIVLVLGFRWLQSRTGRTLHTIVSLISPILFFSAYIFDRGEPNIILVAWMLTITMIPTLYLFLLYQSAMKRKFLERQPSKAPATKEGR